MTSNAPGSGISISSSWKASIGSPSRSWRMTQAAMVGGSSPGSTSSLATWLVSTAIAAGHILSVDWRVKVAGCYRGGGLEPVLALDPEQGQEQDGRHHQAADAVD